MQEVAIDSLKPITPLPHPMLHKSGTILLKAKDELTEGMIAFMRQRGVQNVYFPDPGERPEEVRRTLTHTPMAIGDLKPGDRLTRTLYDSKGRLLLEVGTEIPKNFAPSLQRRGITTIYFRRPAKELNKREADALIEGLDRIRRGKEEGISEEKVEAFQQIQLEEAKEEDFDARKLQAKIDRLKKIEVLPEGEPILESIRDTRQEGPASAAEKQSFSTDIRESMDTLRQAYEDLSRNGKGGRTRTLDTSAIDRIASQGMAGLIRHRELLMLCGMSEKCEDYLASHAVAMMTLALNVGAFMGFGAVQVKSLAYGSLFKNVGMLRVPRELLDKPGKLTGSEFAQVRRHPSFALDMLQGIRNIPAEVPYVAYQSHERANGSGYPCGKRDAVIHAFAKIVGVVDIYAAACAERPYREALTPYVAMEQLVLMCGKRVLNSDTVRAFLRCNSLFPVGSFVGLADGRLARVVAANSDDYMRPVLALLTDAQKTSLALPERLDLLSNKEVAVTTALSPRDVPGGEDPMVGF